MVAAEASNRVINTVPAAVLLELLAPAACSNSGSFDPAPACAVAAAGESSSGSAAGMLVGSVAGVVAAGVAEGAVVAADGTWLAGASGVAAVGEVLASDGVEAAGSVLAPVASAAPQDMAACHILYKSLSGCRRWGSWTGPGRGTTRWDSARALTRRRCRAPGPGGSSGAGSSRN